MENWTNLDKGREGVKNPGNFADIICTWPLMILISLLGHTPSSPDLSSIRTKDKDQFLCEGDSMD